MQRVVSVSVVGSLVLAAILAVVRSEGMVVVPVTAAIGGVLLIVWSWIKASGPEPAPRQEFPQLAA